MILRRRKKCAICKKKKLLTEFTKNKKRKEGRGSYCKPCDNIKKNEWVSNNRERYNATVRKGQKKYRETTDPKKLKAMKVKHDHTRRLKKFGLNQEEFDILKSKSNGYCMICGKSESDTHTNLHIDHCHSTGSVRGLLCTNCNTTLGLVKDNTNTLLKMINYLEKDYG